MNDPLDKFRDEVELMTLDEIQTAIDARLKEMNSYTLAVDDHRRHLTILHDQKRERLVH